MGHTVCPSHPCDQCTLAKKRLRWHKHINAFFGQKTVVHQKSVNLGMTSARHITNRKSFKKVTCPFKSEGLPKWRTIGTRSTWCASTFPCTSSPWPCSSSAADTFSRYNTGICRYLCHPRGWLICMSHHFFLSSYAYYKTLQYLNYQSISIHLCILYSNSSSRS